MQAWWQRPLGHGIHGEHQAVPQHQLEKQPQEHQLASNDEVVGGGRADSHEQERSPGKEKRAWDEVRPRPGEENLVVERQRADHCRQASQQGKGW